MTLKKEKENCLIKLKSFKLRVFKSKVIKTLLIISMFTLIIRFSNNLLFSGKVVQFDKKDNYYSIDLFIKNDILYIAGGNNWLEIVNISDPKHPSELRQYNKTSYAQGIFVRNNTIFIADGKNGLVILEQSNSYELIEQGRWNQSIESDETNGYASEIYVLGQFAYLADGYDGLEIYNITDLNNPVLVSQYKIENCYTSDLFVQESTIYIANGKNGIEILNISDPLNLTKIGQYSDQESISVLYIFNNMLYVSGNNNFLEIIDISNPNIPEKVGFLNLGNSLPLDIFVSDNVAYCASGYDGLVTVDITDPTNPNKIGNYYDGGFAYNVLTHDDYIFMADGEDGVEIFDKTAKLSSGFFLIPWITNIFLIIEGLIIGMVVIFLFFQDIFENKKKFESI